MLRWNGWFYFFLLLIDASVFKYSVFLFFRSAEFAANHRSISIVLLITSLNASSSTTRTSSSERKRKVTQIEVIPN